MKKMVALFLICIMMVGLCSCGSEPEAPVETVLTPENISDYLEFDFKYENSEYVEIISGVGNPYTDLVMTVYPVVSDTFENVEITMEITCPDGWGASLSDPAYNESDEAKMEISFRLPTKGEYTETHRLVGSWDASTEPNEDCTVKFISVSGTCKPR